MKDKEAIREYKREYYRKNKEKVLETNKRWGDKNKEKMKEYHKEYSKENKERINKRLREHRKKTGNAVTKRYEKTKGGFLVRKYRNMQSRIEGIQKKSLNLYKGLELLPREDFYEWAIDNRDFLKLFSEWEQSGYERKLCPTVDRIDPKKGYSIPNMRWLTLSENSRLGGKAAYKKLMERRLRGCSGILKLS